MTSDKNALIASVNMYFFLSFKDTDNNTTNDIKKPINSPKAVVILKKISRNEL
jgi:hypothetical protein